MFGFAMELSFYLMENIQPYQEVVIGVSSAIAALGCAVVMGIGMAKERPYDPNFVPFIPSGLVELMKKEKRNL